MRPHSALKPSELASTRVLTGLSQALLDELIDRNIVGVAELEALPAADREEVRRSPEVSTLIQTLMRHRLITGFQASKIGEGRIGSLVIGNYRLLDRIGSGGMGVVYKAEHRRMRRPVAIKVFEQRSDLDERFLARFFSEIEATSKLQHPNIVTAFDAGDAPAEFDGDPCRYYLVMEFVPGEDLERRVRNDGPFSTHQACDIACQLADALSEAHRNGLVHRDVKPSNVLVTPSGQVKLLDFGLVRRADRRFTEQDYVLGTVDYMAPEQARDATNVDARADIYSLGGTIYWCLAGRPPFPPSESVFRALVDRQSQAPPSLLWIDGVTPQLDAVVRRMMATDPSSRFGSAAEVLRALDPHRKPVIAAPPSAEDGRETPSTVETVTTHRVLIVDDEPLIRRVCRFALEMVNIQCEEAENGVRALEMIGRQRYDSALLDIDMPELNGRELCDRIRENPDNHHMKVIMMSGRSLPDDLARMLSAGADDFLAKPISVVQLQSRVINVLRLRDAQVRSDVLARRLLGVNAELERALSARDGDLIRARNALVLTLAKLVEHREIASGLHTHRLQRTSRLLAEAVVESGTIRQEVDESFLDMIECCAPLHDIGKMALPDYILLKAGELDPQEVALMQTHTVIGSEILREVARLHPFAQGFLQMADDIARHHHERFDGTGYPDRLMGDSIPLSARIVALCDHYDVLRSRRQNKPALSHAATVALITQQSPGRFDRRVVAAFEKRCDQFEQFFRDFSDSNPMHRR
jgi:response regulator RpfG family c-di-GMP phosphodiesterase/serine/threonine protein kinase